MLFLLWLHPFILSGVISPLISSTISGTYWPGELIFQCPVFFAFSYYSWGSQGKNTEVVCHPLLQWTTFCQTSPPWPVHLGQLHMAWLSFIDLDKAVVHVIRLASCLWFGFSLSAPWYLLSVPTIFLGFLLPCISLHGCSSKTAYLTSMQSTSWEMLGWKKHKLESRLLGEISVISDMQRRRQWQPTPVLLPGKSRGRSFLGCSPWGR